MGAIVAQRGVAAEEKASFVDELQACRNWLAERAADQPANFAHLLLLVEAEQAWALGDMWKAAAAFDAALAEPGIRARPWHRAVITERAGLFHLATGLVHAGRRLIADARDQFMARKLQENAQRGVVLLAGNGHVRADIGVPHWLAPAVRARSEAIGVPEEGDTVTAFDSRVFTPAQARPDPCEKMRRTVPGPAPEVRR